MFEIRILTENDAFADDPRPEIIRILDDIRTKIGEWDGDPYWRSIIDVNGNNVGSWRLRTIPEVSE